MVEIIVDFKKRKKYLVCIDSDGCAMDTMEVKHRKCFGPKAVEIWELQAIEAEFLETWNRINLYTKTRGINRFKGLVETFKCMEAKRMDIPSLAAVEEWTQTASELSNPALEKAVEQTGAEQLAKALAWSNAVNKAIRELQQEDKPFPYVKESLKIISETSDIAIVSSANGSAVKDEWTRHELLPRVQIMFGQEAGTKAACINCLKKHDYNEDEVLMVGDAPGDLEAAERNGVLFYPILVGKEGFSWDRLASEALPKFIGGSYRGEYQQKLIEEFDSLLK